jgi:hypothetical protein
MGQRSDVRRPLSISRAVFTLERPIPQPFAARIQRVRLIMQLAAFDLLAWDDLPGPEAGLLAQLRTLHADAQQAWSRLQQEFTPEEIARALAGPTSATLTLGSQRHPTHFLLIAGELYAACSITPHPPAIQSLWKLTPISDRGLIKDSYSVLRLKHGPDQCDCPDWYFRVLETDDPLPCKHLLNLDALGWLGRRPSTPPPPHVARLSPH